MKVRDELRRIAYELGSSRGFYTKDDVIAELRRRRPDLINKESRRLEEIAMKRLLGDIESRQVRNFDPKQYDLLGGILGLPLSVPAPKEGGQKGRQRAFLLKINIATLRKHAIRSAELRRARDHKTPLEQLFDIVSPAADDDQITVEEALHKLREN